MLTPKDVHSLAEKSWPDLMYAFIKVDRIIGPRARRLHRPKQQVSQANHAPPSPAANPTAWDTARPHQQPASWGQGTVSMPTVRLAGKPMSISQIGAPHQHESAHPPCQHGGAATPPCQSESVYWIRDNRCTNCCDHVPTGAAHPDPCLKPPTCHHCQALGQLKRDCPVPATPAHPEMHQMAIHQPAPPPRGKGRRRNQGHRWPHNPLATPVTNPPAVAGQATVNMMGHTTPRPPSRHGNRLSNVNWGRTPLLLRDTPCKGKSGGEGLSRDQRIERMGRELAEIRQVIEGAMGEMAKLNDHVDYQLDLRAPFAFLPFNQIIQAPADAPPISATSWDRTPYPALHHPVQVDPGHREPAWGELAPGSLCRITEEADSLGSHQADYTDLFQGPRKTEEPTGHPGGPGKAGGVGGGPPPRGD